MVQNTMKLTRQANGHIKPNYDIFTNNIDDIYRESNDIFDMIINGFRFGYMQGIKAAKAEMKGGAGNE